MTRRSCPYATSATSTFTPQEKPGESEKHGGSKSWMGNDDLRYGKSFPHKEKSFPSYAIDFCQTIVYIIKEGGNRPVLKIEGDEMDYKKGQTVYFDHGGRQRGGIVVAGPKANSYQIEFHSMAFGSSGMPDTKVWRHKKVIRSDR
jgi:hypothetical protein